MAKISFKKESAAPAPETNPTPTPAPETNPVVVESTTTVCSPSGVVDVSSVSEIPTAPVNLAVAKTVPQPVTVSETETHNSFNDEDIGFNDIILPRLNIVQKVGDLSNIFNPGEIVLNQTLVIHEPAVPEKSKVGHSPIILTVLGFRKRQFCEKKEGGALGNLFNTEAEVVQAGGTLDYKEHKSTKKTLYQRLATALLLIQKPEHLSDGDNINFPYECEGKWYALALWSMKGTAYTNSAKLMYTARKIGHLRVGYPTQAWSVTTKLEKYPGDLYAHIPIVRPGPKNTPKFAEFVLEVLGAGQ